MAKPKKAVENQGMCPECGVGLQPRTSATGFGTFKCPNCGWLSNNASGHVPDKFTLKFGSLAESIIEQLREQGLKVHDNEAFQHFQRDADYVTWLSVRGIMTELERRSVRARLMENVKRYLIMGLEED